jgi:hypothetical protein
MPKTSNEGPSYAGLTDVSPPETATPEWVPVNSDAAKAAEAVEAKLDKALADDDKADDKADKGGKDAKPADVSRETKQSDDESKTAKRTARK